MREGVEITAGDKIELSDENNRVYKTVVWEVMSDGSILVTTPSYRGIPASLHAGEEFVMAFFRESGVYKALVRATGMLTSNNVRFARLVRISDIERSQRREYYRLPIRLKADVCEYAEGMTEDSATFLEAVETIALESTETKDLSVTGVSITMKREYRIGEKYMLKLQMDEHGEKGLPLIAYVEVVRITMDEDNRAKQVGMRFFEQKRSTGDFLAKYVLARQQRLVMRKRLVEEDLE